MKKEEILELVNSCEKECSEEFMDIMMLVEKR